MEGKACPFYHVNDAMFIYVDWGGRSLPSKEQARGLIFLFLSQAMVREANNIPERCVHEMHFFDQGTVPHL